MNRPSMNGVTGAGDDYTDNELSAGPWLADGDIMRRVVANGTTWRTPTRDTNDRPCPDTQLFWRAHANRCNFAFADGSVRKLRYSIDPVMFMRACKRDDGEPVELN